MSKAEQDYAGITRVACCSACNAENCVLTRAPVCGHPFKSTHPGADAATTKRIATARRIIKHQDIDRRG